MGMILKLVWFAGGCAAVGLILWSGAGPVFDAIAAAGWGVLAVVLLRGVAVSAAGIAWSFLFPAGLRPSAWTCVLIRFLREGANALLPITQIGGEVIGARVLTLRGAPPSLAAASVIVDVLVQAVTQFLFAAIGLAVLASVREEDAIRGTAAIVIAAAVPALGGFYLAQRPVGQRIIKALLRRVVGEREWLSFGAIDALYARLASIYANRKGVMTAACIHSLVWLFGALEVWAMLAFMGYPSGYPEALVVESLMQAIRGAAFAIPGALGAQEGGLVVLCAIFGVPAGAALAMSLIKRVPDLVFGIPSLVGWQVVEGRALLGLAASAEGGRGR
ncbi:MAG: flippase-like domain-containing protein [Hyphomicrobiales bacterium]|nr:flippase-like domain-containing protein [Hyphomicrobiales bacterium]MBV8439774.1 flippase-like domain-containing protein [Hyphomicrobiales bacterium]